MLYYRLHYSNPVISIVLPTYNEAGNLPGLLAEIRSALERFPFEVIVVDDDSPDHTWEIAATLGAQVRAIRRVGRRGLSSAVVEGFHAAKGEILIAMDADGQHDPRLIPKMIAALEQRADIAVGSRYVPGGSVEGWIEARHFASRIATALARLVTQVRVEDPMSGFFAMRKKMFEQIAPRLRPSGFKILLEILSCLPKTARAAEVPLVFRRRRAGASKLTFGVELQYLSQILRLFFTR